MKWIGQHIWGLISRFRNDVYLEDIDTGTIASGGNLGLDSNNKIVKATVSGGGSGDLTAIVAGTGLSGTSLTGPIPTLNVDAAQTGITSLGTLSSLAVTSASDLGSAAMTLTNADLDQIALDINASNTTANVIDISAVDANSGNVIFIDSADAVNEINIDKDYGRTSSHTGQVIKIASDKTSVTADGQTYSQTGLISSVSDGGRNHANATSVVVNQDLTSSMGYTDGTTTLYGIKNRLTGAADTAAGIYSDVENDLGPDIYMVDSADTTNYCQIGTTANGALNITTHDQSGADANVSFAVDGTFSVVSTGIDIAADGTITNAAWQGTSIGTAYTDAKVTSILAGDGIDVSGATGDVTVTAETATDSNPGIVELATDGETALATDSTKAVTPASLGVALTAHTLGRVSQIINLKGYAVLQNDIYDYANPYNTDDEAPFQMDTSYGSGTIGSGTEVSQSKFFRAGGFHVPFACTVATIQTQITCNNGGNVSIAIVEYRPSDVGSDVNDYPRTVYETVVNASDNSNNKVDTVTIATGDLDETAVPAGSHLMMMVKGDGTSAGGTTIISTAIGLSW